MVVVIVLVVALWAGSVGVYMVLSRSLRNSDLDRIKGRLLGTPKAKQRKKQAPTAQLMREGDQGQSSALARLMRRHSLHDTLQSQIEQAGLSWTPAKLVQGSLALFLISLSVCWSLMPPQFRVGALLPALFMGLLPYLHLRRTRASRLKKFEEQFPESLEFISRSMRAGHAFSVSLEMIHKEFKDPLGGEFKRAFDEHNLGLPLDVALEKLAQRIPSLDVHFFVSAVLLQKRTGGNLAEVLDKLAYIIRERFKLRGKIRAITAHGRMTGIALSSIPIGVAVLMFYTNTDYVKFFFTDEVGNWMLGAAVLLQAIGYGVIQKIVKIEV